MATKLKITLKRSPIGYEKSQGATARGLGLKKINQTVEQDDNPVIRGMVHKIQHLLAVEQIVDPAAE